MSCAVLAMAMEMMMMIDVESLRRIVVVMRRDGGRAAEAK